MLKRVGYILRIIVAILLFFNTYLYIHDYLHGDPILAPRDPESFVIKGEEKARFLKLRMKHGDVIVEGWPKKPIFYRDGKKCSFT